MGDLLKKYKDELTRAMKMLAQDERTIFIGQNLLFPGNGLYDTFQDVPTNKRIEFPVAEDMQMGLCIGMSLDGRVPVSIYPRMDFLIVAVNQLVNHLDKIKDISRGQFNPKVIIRTAIGAKEPMYPGLQHCSDYTEALRGMLWNVKVVKLCESKDVVPAYKEALSSNGSTLLVELADKY